jgi:phosphate acetyltransferase
MPSDLIEALAQQARTKPQRVILTETAEKRVLRTARQVADRGIAQPVLLGNPADITALATEIGVDLTGLQLLDPNEPELVETVIREYRSRHDRLSEKTLRRKLKTPLNLACALVMVGRADAVAAGVTCSTAEVVLSAQTMIGTQPGIDTISSLGILEIPGFAGSEGNLIAIADCAVCPAPGPRELADIAACSAQTVADLLGWEPRVAMLSFSTRGSGDHETVRKVIDAVANANARFPELLIDGEFQLDAAIDPQVASRKVGDGSQVAGRANVLVFPDLNAGNIGVKLVQQFARAVAHGPVLQGFARPITDFSRSAPVEEMVGAIAIVAVRALRASQRSGQEV